MAVKDLAYHQGTVWPWLIGPYCDALAIVQYGQGISHEETKREISRTIAPLVQFCLESEFKSLPEGSPVILPTIQEAQHRKPGVSGKFFVF